MEWRLWLYMAVALAYVGYPLYLLMGPAHSGNLRVLSLGLLTYGLVGLFWPGGAADALLLFAGMSVAAGLGLMFQVPLRQTPWLIALGYSASVLGSTTVTEPAWTFVAALIFVIAFERTVVRSHLEAPTSGHSHE